MATAVDPSRIVLVLPTAGSPSKHGFLAYRHLLIGDYATVRFWSPRDRQWARYTTRVHVNRVVGGEKEHPGYAGCANSVAPRPIHA